MKLTRNETYAHNRCLELLKKDTLTDQEKEYILINYHEGANHNNSAAGAFFTPIRMSFEFSNDVIMSINGDEITIIDLCAGIGMLSYPIITRLKNLRIKFRHVCIEYNREYVEVGQKLLPEAEWYCMDVCDWEEIKKLGHFDIAISNPPFGSVGTFRGKETPRYKGSDAEYKVIDVAYEVSDHGAFLIPQASVGFEYSGKNQYQVVHNSKYKRFMKSTGLELELGMSIDTSVEDMYTWEYDDGTETESNWKGVNPVVEFVNCMFTNYRPDNKPKITLF